MIEEAKHECLSIADQLKLKDYLERFYADIYHIKLYIQIHSDIADIKKLEKLSHEQFWAFMQCNVIIKLVIANIFSIFDNKKNSTIKKFVGFLKAKTINGLTIKEVLTWINQLEPYKNFRNSVIAHSELVWAFEPVNYLNLLNILEQFEQRLRHIHKNYITHYSVINQIWSTSEVSQGTAILTELRQLLRSKIKP